MNVKQRLIPPQTHFVQLGSIIRDLELGYYGLPTFQRGYVWLDEQVLELADSITQGFPIGPIVVWRQTDSKGLRSSFGRIEFPTSPKPVLVIDGQQRLGSLARLFSYHSPEDWRIDLETGTWRLAVGEDEAGIGVDWMPGKTMKMLDIYRWRPIFPGDFNTPGFEMAARWQQHFSNYTIVVITLDETSSVSYVVETFVRLARHGTPISEEDLRAALSRLEEERQCTRRHTTMGG